MLVDRTLHSVLFDRINARLQTGRLSAAAAGAHVAHLGGRGGDAAGRRRPPRLARVGVEAFGAGHRRPRRRRSQPSRPGGGARQVLRLLEERREARPRGARQRRGGPARHRAAVMAGTRRQVLSLLGRPGARPRAPARTAARRWSPRVPAVVPPHGVIEPYHFDISSAVEARGVHAGVDLDVGEADPEEAARGLARLDGVRLDHARVAAGGLLWGSPLPRRSPGGTGFPDAVAGLAGDAHDPGRRRVVHPCSSF